MSNENLRAALQHAGITTDQLADQVQVDERTVRRWLAGGVPHARQRAAVARALDRDQVDLWPEIAVETERRSTPTSDLIAGYPGIDRSAPPDWQDLLRGASKAIDLLGQTLAAVINTPGMADVLAAKAQQGCAIRLLLAAPKPELRALLGRPGIDIRVMSSGAWQTIHRYDDQLLLELHVYGDDKRQQAPTFHLRRRSPGGLFDTLVRHYELTWQHHARSLDPETDIPKAKPDTPQPTETTAAQPGARRWPRQPPTS
jgi:lambda repressor-like predicted transcriptional regulator